MTFEVKSYWGNRPKASQSQKTNCTTTNITFINTISENVNIGKYEKVNRHEYFPVYLS